jgi:hypothetical protein
MLRDIKTYQRLARKIYVRIDGSDVNGGTLTTTGVIVGSQQVKVTETGNGAYTITLNEPGSRACFAVGCGLTDNSYITISSTTASTVLVKQETVTTGVALADADFWLEITAFDSSDET